MARRLKVVCGLRERISDKSEKINKKYDKRKMSQV